MSTRIITLALVLLFGCRSFALGGADRSALKSATLVEACPLGVPWTRVNVTDTSDGLEIDFATSLPSNVDELRRRVRDQARAFGPNRHRGAGHDGEHGGPRDHGLRLWTMGELRTKITDTPAGAKLVVAPVDAARRAELRERIVQRVADLEAADCPDR